MRGVSQPEGSPRGNVGESVCRTIVHPPSRPTTCRIKPGPLSNVVVLFELAFFAECNKIVKCSVQMNRFNWLCVSIAWSEHPKKNLVLTHHVAFKVLYVTFGSVFYGYDSGIVTKPSSNDLKSNSLLSLYNVDSGIRILPQLLRPECNHDWRLWRCVLCWRCCRNGAWLPKGIGRARDLLTISITLRLAIGTYPTNSDGSGRYSSGRWCLFLVLRCKLDRRDSVSSALVVLSEVTHRVS